MHLFQQKILSERYDIAKARELIDILITKDSDCYQKFIEIISSDPTSLLAYSRLKYTEQGLHLGEYLWS